MNTWNGLNKHGFCTVPDVLWTHYKECGLTSSERYLVIAIQKYDFGKSLPFPKVSTICKMLDWSETKVRRGISSLRKKELLITRNRGGRSLYYDFSPLFSKMTDILGGKEIGGEESNLPCQSDKADLAPVHSQTTPFCHPEEHKLKNTTEEEIHPVNVSTKMSKDSEKPPSLINQTISGILAKSNVREINVPKKDKSLRPGFVKRPNRTFKTPPRNNRFKDKIKGGKGYWYRVYKAKAVSEYRCHDIAFHFYEQWKKRWPNIPIPKFSRGDKQKATIMLREYKAQTTIDTITAVIQDWEKYKETYSLNGFPSIALIYGYRSSWASEIILKKTEPVKNKDTQQASNAIKEMWG
jgi:hypothetical protein